MKRMMVFVAASLAALLMLNGISSSFAAEAKKEELSESYRGSQRDNVEYQKIAPFKLFDNLYYVGIGSVGAWALTTSEGIILFDTLNNPQEAETYIVDGLKKIGLNHPSHSRRGAMS